MSLVTCEADRLTKSLVFRDTQQTARFLSSQAKRLDALDVSAFIDCIS